VTYAHSHHLATQPTPADPRSAWQHSFPLRAPFLAVPTWPSRRVALADEKV
jgi:hypothetical protein